MFGIFRRSQPLPPSWQPALGRSDDRAAFEAPEPSFLERLFGSGSDGRVYEMDAADQKRLRPTFIKSERTIRNERIAAERARKRLGSDSRGGKADSGPGVHFAPDSPMPAPGTAPPAYSLDKFCESQPDMPAAVRRALTGVVTRQFGPMCVDEPFPPEVPSAAAIREMEATAAALLGAGRSVVIPAVFHDRGSR